MRIDNVLGIVVEYNPFHNGHLYHLRRSRELSGADAVVAVMSGPFLQRGEPALVNKWARTEMALKAGVDLVIELPVLFSAQAAEWFAYGAVTALEATGVVNRLCFGSESGQIDWMLQLARLLAQEPRALKDELKRRLARGMRYPDAYSEAVATVIGQNEAHVTKEQLSRPNNTLGLHYLIALERIQSRIIPMTISRTEAEYDETILRGGSIASATAIRRRWLTEGTLDSLSPYIPRSTLDILHREFACGRAPIHWERYWLPLCHQILSQSLDSLRDIYEVTEGLEYRIVRQLNRLHEPQNFEAYLHALKTKRYTRTKLQRTLLRILLHHSKRMFTRSVLATGTPYLRILGMTPTGQKLLKRMKTSATVPIVQQPARHPSALLELDLRASAVYALGYPDSRTNGAHDEFVQAPLVLRSGQ